jgi:DNA-binding transcriptional regulator YdaS (Cro superfamily)
MNEPPLIGVQAAVRSLDRKGTVADLARLLGISRVAVLNWGNTIPLARLMQVERVTGVPREVLRPDFIDEITKLGVPTDVLRPSLVRRSKSRRRAIKAALKAA